MTTRKTDASKKGRMFVSEIRECLSPKEEFALIDSSFEKWHSWAVNITSISTLTPIGMKNEYSKAFCAGYLAGSKSVEMVKTPPSSLRKRSNK